MEIISSSFESLSATRLYDILKLRQDVFMWEENIHYPDLDDVDKSAVHVFALDKKDGKETIAAYARVYSDAAEGHVKIGRVVASPSYRGRGLASGVVRKAVAEAAMRFGVPEVWLDSQEHVISFYEGLGFTIASEPFVEAGIKHVRMVHNSPFFDKI